MKPATYAAVIFCDMLLLTECSSGASGKEVNESVQSEAEPFTRSTKIEEVIHAPVFDGFGRLLFPLDNYYYSGDTLEDLRLVYYSHIDPDETVEIVNTLRSRAEDGQTVFYDIYTDEEKAADPVKEDTGLFFFKGTPGKKFALIYRPGAVIMQYTGLSEYSENDSPTYACVGDRDGIANWRIMQARLGAMQEVGIDTEFHVYPGLGHGFGFGTATSAEGWLGDAVAFWERQMKA